MTSLSQAFDTVTVRFASVKMNFVIFKDSRIFQAMHLLAIVTYTTWLLFFVPWIVCYLARRSNRPPFFFFVSSELLSKETAICLTWICHFGAGIISEWMKLRRNREKRLERQRWVLCGNEKREAKHHRGGINGGVSTSRKKSSTEFGEQKETVYLHSLKLDQHETKSLGKWNTQTQKYWAQLSNRKTFRWRHLCSTT